MTVLLALAALTWRYWLLRRSTNLPLPTLGPPPAGSRVLILAPHPDDEALAAGGLIQVARATGAPVLVVLATAGDGPGRLGAAGAARPDATAYRRRGRERLAESAAAARVLGLPPGDVVLLGFPDGGLDQLWETNWPRDRPYRSPTTGATAVPYVDAWRPGVAYTGSALLATLEQVISTFRPTWVVLPTTLDEHPDHWALGAFTQLAVADLEHRGRLGPVRLLTYLVHRGDWPLPPGWHPQLPLSPPDNLLRLGVTWSALPLTPRQVADKGAAIRAYASQTARLGTWLGSFDRTDEPFATAPVGVATWVSPAMLAAPGGWDAVPQTFPQPRRSSPLQDVTGSGDITAIRVAVAPTTTWIRLDTAGRPAKSITYEVRLHLLEPTTGEPRVTALDLAMRAGGTATARVEYGDGPPPVVVGGTGAHWLVFQLAVALPDGEPSWIEAGSTRAGVIVHQSPWEPLAVPATVARRQVTGPKAGNHVPRGVGTALVRPGHRVQPVAGDAGPLPGCPAGGRSDPGRCGAGGPPETRPAGAARRLRGWTGRRPSGR